MGCASSKHMISATGDSLLNQSQVTVLNSVPTGELVLKDLPEVVEKVIDVLKETDLETAHDYKKVDILHVLNDKVDSTAEEIDAKKIMLDADSESSLQGIVQGFLADNVSNNSKQSIQEAAVEYYKPEGNSPSLLADIDSLRTSSPESEIEQLLANINDQNPPTPKPTFSELQDLSTFPINTIDNYVKAEDDSVNLICENTKPKSNCNKLEKNVPVVLKYPTEWEKQADMLANTQKFNPIDAMRKFRKENRSSSSLPHRGDFKPKSQRYFEEDISDFFPMQSPLRSNISSAKSERNVKANGHENDSNGCVTAVRNDAPNKKLQEVKMKKPPDNKRKENNLTVSQNGGVPSPSLYKVRERCAVCCNKYKH